MSSVINFSDLRLKTPITAKPTVLLEYGDRPGDKSYHQVVLSCTGIIGRYIYFGGDEHGEFRIFRSDRILRMENL